jgi:uncharacterized protein (TIGR00266 family)
MQTQLRHNPSFSVARLILAPNEPVRVEGGAMLAHSQGVQIEAKAEGGVFAGLKRSVLAGESFFVTTYTAPPQGGWVDVAGVLPGDIIPIDIVPERPYYIARGNWIANSYGTNIDTQWGGRASLFGGEGGFGIRCSGQGTAVVSVYGAIDIFDLAAGQVVTIDTGHVVAYDLNIQFRMRRAVEGKTIQSMKSGEGFVFDFAGPGRVILQSRNPSAFAAWAASVAPGNNPKGGLGGIFGG